MNLRRLTSLTALWSFTLLAVTGVALFFTPQGQVAYWTHWRLLGLQKEAWGGLHITLSLLFLLVSVVHILLNAKVILHYLRDSARKVRPFTREMAAAVALTGLCTTGTLLGWPPFQWLLEANDQIKVRAGQLHGMPPYGHAEQSSLQGFTQRMGMDLGTAQALLKAKGLVVEGPQDRLQDIATRNHVTPREVYLAMKPAEQPRELGRLPEEVAPGLGRKTLSDLCGEYGLDPLRVRRVLEARQLKVDFAISMRALAEANGTGPHELYAQLRADLH